MALQIPFGLTICCDIDISPFKPFTDAAFIVTINMHIYIYKRLYTFSCRLRIYSSEERLGLDINCIAVICKKSYLELRQYLKSLEISIITVIAWRHQAIAWTNVDLSSGLSCGIQLKAISPEILNISFFDNILKIVYLRIQPHFSGNNVLQTTNS